MISIKNLSFSYGKRAVLSNLSFDHPAGRILGILGPNGAGKSTLLKLLNHRLAPSAGQIDVHQRPLKEYSIRELAQTVATIHQSNRTAFGFTVEELVSMGRAPFMGPFDRLTAEDRNQVEHALNAVGLQELRHRPITHLSGGELQLAHVAKALAQSPELLLMDEATSSLDICHTSQILQLIRKQVRDNGLTVAAVIHDINLAFSFCDDILFIADGQCLGPTAPAELITEETLSTVYGIDRKQITVHSNPNLLECRL